MSLMNKQTSNKKNRKTLTQLREDQHEQSLIEVKILSEIAFDLFLLVLSSVDF